LLTRDQDRGSKDFDLNCTDSPVGISEGQLEPEVKSANTSAE
jgi:hypothetical protein